MPMPMLDVIQMEIASPCPVSWGSMAGDERSRHCGLCDKPVYNIAALTSAEVVDLIARTEGDFCGRLVRRRDGTVLTADCPVGAASAREGRFQRAMTYAVLGLAALVAPFLPKAGALAGSAWPPTGPSLGLGDWIDQARGRLGLGQGMTTAPPPPTFGGIRPAPMILGKIACPAIPTPPVAPVSAPATPAPVPVPAPAPAR